MTAKTYDNAKKAMDLVNGALKIIAAIVVVALAWSAVHGKSESNADRIAKVETELKEFKNEVRAELQSVNAKVHEIAIGVATLVERTRPKP